MLTEDIPVDVGKGYPTELTPRGWPCWIVKILFKCYCHFNHAIPMSMCFLKKIVSWAPFSPNQIKYTKKGNGKLGTINKVQSR